MRQATIKNLKGLDYTSAEMLNTICSNLIFSGRDIKKIVLTSCRPGEGKSFLAMQLMQNLAKRGKRVVLLDADLRKSYLVSAYNITTNGEMLGLVHYLAGYCGMEEIVYETDKFGACFIPIGREVANPIPLFSSDYFTDLMDTLAANFDIVLVDAPPVNVVIDAAEIAVCCDSSILVCKYNETRRREMVMAQNQMKKSGCRILGCIINQVEFDSLSSKKYYNKSGYYNKNSGYYKKSNRDDAQWQEP